MFLYVARRNTAKGTMAQLQSWEENALTGKQAEYIATYAYYIQSLAMYFKHFLKINYMKYAILLQINKESFTLCY